MPCGSGRHLCGYVPQLCGYDRRFVCTILCAACAAPVPVGADTQRQLCGSGPFTDVTISLKGPECVCAARAAKCLLCEDTCLRCAAPPALFPTGLCSLFNSHLIFMMPSIFFFSAFYMDISPYWDFDFTWYHLH